MMASKGLTHSCSRCGRVIIPYPIPYGVVWLCSCGHWIIIFHFTEGRIEFQNGDEESALEYIAKIGQTLG